MHLLNLPIDILKIIISNLDINSFIIIHKVNKVFFNICINKKFRSNFLNNLDIIQNTRIPIHDSNFKSKFINIYYCISCSIKSFDKSNILNNHNCNICKKILCRNYLYHFPLCSIIKYKCINCLSDNDYYYYKLNCNQCLTNEQYISLKNTYKQLLIPCQQIKID